MPLSIPIHLHDPDSPEEVVLPPRLADALGFVRRAIADCERSGIPRDTTLAALMVELMPRLVEAYGAQGVAALLGRLADEVGSGGPPTVMLHGHPRRASAGD